MSRIMLAILFICVLLSGALLPSAQAADWSYSRARAELSAGERAGQAEAEPAAAPVDPLKKNVGKGVMFSLIIPGTGQIYAGSWLRALPWLAIEAAGWTLFASNHGKGQDKTDEFEAFAGPKDDPNNFNVNAYMMREYQVAINPNYNSTVYSGTLAEWKSETWEERQTYLPPPYGHDILTGDIQQYFEMIGKYFEQFAYGWRDTYPGSANLETDWEQDIWDNPAEGFTDDRNTIGFDGTSPLFFQYRDMRAEANDFLDKGNTMMEIVLVNHVLSALDAGFAIRRHNRLQESGEQQSLLKLNYEIKNVNGANARFLTASIPLGSRN